MGEEDLVKLKILENHRDDKLFHKIVDEFCSKFKGQITKEEVITRLKENGFGGVYVLDDDADYEKVDADIRGIVSSGNYTSSIKCITLRASNGDRNVMIGCHELTHALLSGRLSFKISSNEGQASYGIGFEEGIATAVEYMEGNTLPDKDDSRHSAYETNLSIIRQLDLLYQKSSYKRYDSLVVEAIKDPENFFNLIYRIILEFIRQLVYKSNIEDCSEEYIKLMALKTSFINLSSCDMLVEFLDIHSSEEDIRTVKRIANLSRLINISLLAFKDEDIKDGHVASEYVGPFYESDFELVLYSKADRLFDCIFDSREGYYVRLLKYLQIAIEDFVLLTDSLQKEMDMDRTILFKKK